MSKQQSTHAHSGANRNSSLSLNIRRTAVSLAVAAALPGAMMFPSAAMAQACWDQTGWNPEYGKKNPQAPDVLELVDALCGPSERAGFHFVGTSGVEPAGRLAH